MRESSPLIQLGSRLRVNDKTESFSARLVWISALPCDSRRNKLQAFVNSPFRLAGRGHRYDCSARVWMTLRAVAMSLLTVGGRTGPAIDNLDRAERFGWLTVEPWLDMRSLRNQMIHEYVEDMNIPHNALTSGLTFVPQLIATAECMAEEIVRRRLCDQPDMA
jgi:uncharacterized protein with HEPN domain